MQPLEIDAFLQKFAAGTHTQAEHQQFAEWLLHAPVTEVETVLEAYKKIAVNINTAAEKNPIVISRIENALDQYELGRRVHQNKARIIGWRSFAAVAALLVLFLSSAAIWISLSKDAAVAPPLISVLQNKESQNELLPGVNKAILTLSNGAVISLDGTKNGEIARQGNTIVDKSSNGQLVYQVADAATVDVVYNTLTTPRGGQYRLTLADGSEVWLNAATTIKYPASFPGNERRVEIKGEAYFEIAHNAGQPFIVSSNGMEVKVLGTHFNVNSYTDEKMMKTSLLEGSISLSKNGHSAMLKAGQQAQLSSAGDFKVLSDVDMEEVVAWKNGYFSFNHADLQTVMRQISRWYDVDISYEGPIPARLFGGKIDRNSNASDVLKILEESKVHFSVQNRKIIVKP